MLKISEDLKLRLALLGLLIALMLGAGFSADISLSAPKDPFAEYAEPFQFTLSVPDTSDEMKISTTASGSLSGWTQIDAENFPSNTLGDWESRSYSANLADAWGPGLIADGNWGAWVRGRAEQADLSSSTTYTYTPNMDTWLVYGPIDNSDRIWDLRLAFDYFISLGTGDAFVVGHSSDGVNFEGLRITSLKMNPQMWAGAQVNWPIDYDTSQLWVAFGFTSNDDADVAQGVWLDSLVLEANYGGQVYMPLLTNQYSTGPVVTGFYDNFSNPDSGWSDRLYEHSDGVDLMRVGYVDQTYRMKILLNYDARNNRLMGIAKAPYVDVHTNYDLQVEHSFVEAGDQVVDPDGGKGSLIFAANDGFSTIYAFEWNYAGNCAINKYTNVDFPVTMYEDGDIQTHTIMGWRNCSDFNLEGGYNADNKLLVEVRDNKATIYVMEGESKTKVREFTDDALRDHRRVGLVTGSWDLTPVESRFDNFWIEPVE